MQMLREKGISAALANKAANAEARAFSSLSNLLKVYDELERAGKGDVANMLWHEFYTFPLIDLPKQSRREFMETVLKLAEKIVESLEHEE